MDEARKSTESQSTDQQLGAGQESILKSAARKVGSTIGGIAARMSEASAKPNVNPYESMSSGNSARRCISSKRSLRMARNCISLGSFP